MDQQPEELTLTASNPATRLRALLTEALNNPQGQMPTVMLRAFRLDGEPPEEHDDLAAHCVMAVRAEIDELVLLLREKNCPEELYSEISGRVRVVFTNQHMGVDFTSLRGNITESAMMALSWAGVYLGAQEFQIDAAEYNRMLAEVDRLLGTVESLPPLSKHIAKTHLKRLRRALLFYPVEGIGPLEAEMNDLGAALHLHEDQLIREEANADPATKTLIQQAGAFWARGAEWVDKAAKVKKTVDTAIGLGHSMVELYHKLPWNGSQ